MRCRCATAASCRICSARTGIVAQGELGADGVFTAGEVLAKHDENYMPPEVAEALKRAGVWRHTPAGAGGQP